MKQESLSGKTILITGGAGFIGSNLALYIQEHFKNTRIVIFDIFRNLSVVKNEKSYTFGHYCNLLGFKGDVICGDIANALDLNLLKKYKFDYIFHQAAISDTRMYNQELVMKTNVNSFYTILDIAKTNQAKLIYASSASTYGASTAPQSIGNEAPENPYGFSKYLMDNIASNFLNEYPDLHIVGLRYFNVYGEKEFFKHTTASMVLQLGHQLLSGNKPRLFENSENIKRDFVYIKDVIKANILACFTKRNGVYNVGTGHSRSFLDIVTILQKQFETTLDIDYFKNPYTAYQMHTEADISLSKTHLNYESTYTLEEGIKAYIPYIKESFNWDIT